MPGVDAALARGGLKLHVHMPFYSQRGPAPDDVAPDLDDGEVAALLQWFANYQAEDIEPQQQDAEAAEIAQLEQPMPNMRF